MTLKLEHMGFTPKTKAHDARLTTAENRFLGILWLDHVGLKNAIGADDLAVRFRHALEGVAIRKKDAARIVEHLKAAWPSDLDQMKRDVRAMQNHLLTRHENIYVLSRAGSGGGYWIADTADEAEAFYDSFRQRGLTGLVKASRGKRSAMVEMMQQLTFEFDSLADRTGYDLPQMEKGRDTLPLAMVDRFLTRMLESPERFRDDLRKLSTKFGGVLFSKGQAAQMKAKVAELNALVEGL